MNAPQAFDKLMKVMHKGRRITSHDLANIMLALPAKSMSPPEAAASPDNQCIEICSELTGEADNFQFSCTQLY